MSVPSNLLSFSSVIVLAALVSLRERGLISYEKSSIKNAMQLAMRPLAEIQLSISITLE